MRLDPDTVPFTLFLAAIGALPPLAIDMGLPALAAIGHSLGIDAATAGLTLSLFLAGFGIGPLVAGPLGRRLPLAAGLLLFAIGGLLAGAAPSIATLLANALFPWLGILAMTGCMAGFAALSAVCCLLLRRNGLNTLAERASFP